MPNIVYTVAERVEMVRLREQGTSYQRISDYFAAAYPDRPIPSKSNVQYIIKKFYETGNVDPNLRKVVQPKKRLSEETKINICLTAEEGLNKPLSQIGKEFSVAKSTVRKVLQSYIFEPFELKAHQQLSEPKIERHIVSSKNMINYLNADPTLINRVCFSYETAVLRVESPKKQKSKTRVQKNPRRLIQSHAQYQEKLNVWAGILGNKIIGPFFMDGNLTGGKYLRMLRQQIVPALRAIQVNGPIWFQQDGAPPHFSAAVRTYLEEEFPSRWIVRGSQVQCPPQSSDSSPVDHSLWNSVKNKIHGDQTIENLAALRTRITAILNGVDPKAIVNMNYARLS